MTDQFARKSEAWSARFSEPVSELVKRYTASVGFDKRLAMADMIRAGWRVNLASIVIVTAVSMIVIPLIA